MQIAATLTYAFHSGSCDERCHSSVTNVKSPLHHVRCTIRHNRITANPPYRFPATFAIAQTVAESLLEAGSLKCLRCCRR